MHYRYGHYLQDSLPFVMSSANSSLRQRGGQKEKKASQIQPAPRANQVNGFVDATTKSPDTASKWEYNLALGVITVIAFITRFWGINHPDEVVFDEVHFGKVCLAALLGN